jgi:flagellar biosynthesis protein FlhF
MANAELGMKLKSYFAPTVGAALRQARQELGDGAVLVEARRSPPEARHLGECEVVITLAPPVATDEAGSQARAAEAEPGATAAPGAGRFSIELLELRREVQRMAATMARAGFTAPGASLLGADLAAIFSDLIAAEVDAELAQDVVSSLRAAGGSEGPAELRQRLIAELGNRFSADPQLGRNTEAPRVVALVGPPGAGKTTTLVKLALRHGLTARRPVQLISVDNFRVAAGEQLRSYAAILGVGFQSLESAGPLRQALEEHRHKDLILIDTPGYAAQDMDVAAEVAALLASHPAVDTHLVLTASMKSADLSHAADRFAVFRPRKLIFTRLDETCSFGPLLSQAARTGWAISFLAGGQQIPEDLEHATKERIVELVLGGKAGR